MITYVSGNINKQKEVKRILNEIEIEYTTLYLTEIQEGPVGIIRNKCIEAYKKVKKPVLVEDTSLFINALSYEDSDLDGFPGPYIKHFVNQGLDKIVKTLEPFEDKSARAVCIFGYLDSYLDDPLLFLGITYGKIVDPRGENGFGWDKIFEVNGKTYAEMSDNEKDNCSDRSKALKSFQDFIKKFSRFY